MKIREYIQVKPAGGSPDPATYCPANGYIPNPILPADGWNLLATFQTNSPYTTTFDPAITASSGQYAWDLGDGTILIGYKAISHTYLTTSTRTVKLYGKGTCTITAVDFNGDNIVGALDLSNDAFKTVTSWVLNTNTSITSVVFPSTITATVSILYLYSTGITGTLDLSKFTAFSTSASIYLNSNSSMTGVTFASSITGAINNLLLYSTGITGTLDLSKFTTFTATASISLNSNSSMTGVIFASSITGTINALTINSCNITGTLDLSKFTRFTTSALFQMHSNPLMTGVTFASSITGAINTLYIYSTGITGTLDLSMFTTFSATGDIRLYSNSSMTGVIFASSITGTISQIDINSTGITGTLDLSKFRTYTVNGTLYIQGNSFITGVTFPISTITGFIKALSMYQCTSLGYVDLTKLKTGVDSLSWRMGYCSWSAAIVNKVLADIDGISAAGFASRAIDIGGTNTDPDTTSGGFDGVAARTSLQGKAFAVTIT